MNQTNKQIKMISDLVFNVVTIANISQQTKHNCGVYTRRVLHIISLIMSQFISEIL